MSYIIGFLMKGPGRLERKALVVLGAVYVAVGAFFLDFFHSVTATDREPFIVSTTAIVLGFGIWLALSYTRSSKN